MFLGLLFLLCLFFTFALLLGLAGEKFKLEKNPLAEEINKLLPQTQCGQCGFAGCKAYSEAIAEGKAAINLCIPNGQEGVNKLADFLGLEPLKLAEGENSPLEDEVAFIIEDYCIGCTRCIKVCPVDAILGRTQRIHTVLKSECTGCKLCTKVCPVDCIIMKNRKS